MIDELLAQLIRQNMQACSIFNFAVIIQMLIWRIRAQDGGPLPPYIFVIVFGTILLSTGLLRSFE